MTGRNVAMRGKDDGGNSAMNVDPSLKPCGTVTIIVLPLPSGAVTNIACPGETPGGIVTV